MALPADANARDSQEVPIGPAGDEYYFTLSSKLKVVEPDRLARRPGGTRLSVVYAGSAQSVRTEKIGARPSAWDGLHGDIVSGADFMLFRVDGVLQVDGRIALRARDGTLIDATYKGLIDLYEQLKATAEGDLPRDVVREGLGGTFSDPGGLSDDERAEERAWALLRDLGEAASAVLRHEHIWNAHVDAAEKQRSSKHDQAQDIGKADTESARLAEAVEKVVASIKTESAELEPHPRPGELDPLAVAISSALTPGDGLRLRQAVERALEPRPHTPSALRDAVRKRAPSPRGDLDRAIAAAFPTDERGRVAETLQRAITRKYRAQEFGFYEELINRPTITQGETIFVTMPIWFETASGPWSDAPGEDMTWVGREYRVNESKFWRYRRLVRQPFVARGKLTFEPVGIPGRPPRPAEITLRVYGLTASDERRQTT